MSALLVYSNSGLPTFLRYDQLQQLQVRISDIGAPYPFILTVRGLPTFLRHDKLPPGKDIIYPEG
jgi:hypothetical protein